MRDPERTREGVRVIAPRRLPDVDPDSFMRFKKKKHIRITNNHGRVCRGLILSRRLTCGNRVRVGRGGLEPEGTSVKSPPCRTLLRFCRGSPVLPERLQKDFPSHCLPDPTLRALVGCRSPSLPSVGDIYYAVPLHTARMPMSSPHPIKVTSRIHGARVFRR